MLFLRRAHSPDRRPLDSNPIPTDHETKALTNTPQGTTSDFLSTFHRPVVRLRQVVLIPNRPTRFCNEDQRGKLFHLPTTATPLCAGLELEASNIMQFLPTSHGPVVRLRPVVLTPNRPTRFCNEDQRGKLFHVPTTATPICAGLELEASNIMQFLPTSHRPVVRLRPVVLISNRPTRFCNEDQRGKLFRVPTTATPLCAGLELEASNIMQFLPTSHRPVVRLRLVVLSPNRPTRFCNEDQRGKLFHVPTTATPLCAGLELEASNIMQFLPTSHMPVVRLRQVVLIPNRPTRFCNEDQRGKLFCVPTTATPLCAGLELEASNIMQFLPTSHAICHRKTFSKKANMK